MLDMLPGPVMLQAGEAVLKTGRPLASSSWPTNLIVWLLRILTEDGNTERLEGALPSGVKAVAGSVELDSTIALAVEHRSTTLLKVPCRVPVPLAAV